MKYALMAMFAIVLSVSTAAAAAVADSDVRFVQTVLNAKGYNAGSPDGLWGGKTERAGEAYITNAGIGSVATDGFARDSVAALADHFEAEAYQALPQGFYRLDYGPGSLSPTQSACLELSVDQNVDLIFSICETGAVVYAGTARPFLAEDSLVMVVAITTVNGTIGGKLSRVELPLSRLGKPFVAGVGLKYDNDFSQVKSFKFEPLLANAEMN